VTFGVGNVLGTTVRIWVRNLPRFFLLTVICYVPILAWNLAISIDSFGGWVMEHVDFPLQRLHPALQLEAASGAWIPFAVLGAAIAMCTVGRLRDERVSIWQGLAWTLRRLPWIVGVAFLVRIVTYGVSLTITIARWDDGRYFLLRSTFEYVLVELLWVVLMSLVFVAIPVAIVERRGVFASIRRSLVLGRGERIKVFAVKLVHTVVFSAVFFGTTWLFLVSSDDMTQYADRLVIYAYVRFGINAFLMSLASVLAAVVYERLRAAKEGATPSQLQTVFD